METKQEFSDYVIEGLDSTDTWRVLMTLVNLYDFSGDEAIGFQAYKLLMEMWKVDK